MCAVNTWICMHIQWELYTCKCGGQGSNQVSFWIVLYLIFWDRAAHQTWSSLIQLVPLDSKLLRSACLFPSYWYHRHVHPCPPLTRMQTLYRWVIFPAVKWSFLLSFDVDSLPFRKSTKENFSMCLFSWCWMKDRQQKEKEREQNKFL